ncbi:MAG: methylated-DNA--[protein]-cysteine S-methyltransferase [Planctomycetota bacterium]
MKTLRSIPHGQSYVGRPPLRYGHVATPAGPVSFGTDGERVRTLLLGKRLRDPGRRSALDREVKRQLEQYFAGRRDAFDLPVALDLPRFTSKVLRAVGRIPHGQARSYGEIARAVGQPRAARAVGQAVGANPLPLLIPCHRVLAARGGLGGFGGGLAWKRFLLELEGIGWAER